MSVKEYFEENLRMLSPQKNPISWNMNNGLYALAKQA